MAVASVAAFLPPLFIPICCAGNNWSTENNRFVVCGREIFVSYDSSYVWMSLSFACIYGLDSCVGVRTAQDFTVNQAGQLNVCTVKGFTRYLVVAIVPDWACADNLVGFISILQDYVGCHEPDDLHKCCGF